MKKTVLITGASSGFGKLTATLFADKGWNVVATMRKPDKNGIFMNNGNIECIHLDVTKRDSIKSAINETIEKFGKIDVLVNNAGYGMAGFLEEANQEEIKDQFNTNVIGLINVIQEVIPYMRKEKSGVIINVTSFGGTVGVPMWSIYSSTKFAIEGLSQSLAYELKEFGIYVKTVAPGGYKTRFGDSLHLIAGNEKKDLDYHRKIYKQYLKSMMEMGPKPFNFGDPQEVANEIYRCSTNKTKIKNMIGKDTKIMTYLMNVLPHCMIRTIIRNAAMPNYKN